MTTRQSIIKPALVELAVRNAIARRLRDHGIPDYEAVTDEVITDLFATRLVPTPEGVPTAFYYQGHHVEWPQGVDTRPVTEDEAKTYTRLFSLAWEDGYTDDERKTLKPLVVGTDSNAATLRRMYTGLWARVKTGKATTHTPEASPTCLACGKPAPTEGSWKHECAPNMTPPRPRGSVGKPKMAEVSKEVLARKSTKVQPAAPKSKTVKAVEDGLDALEREAASL